MTIRLPEAYVDRMRRLLGQECDALLDAMQAPRWYGLRVNALKTTPEQYAELAREEWSLEPIPWAEGGYYYAADERPAKHPHYYTGLFYIQEPSAMAPGELLDVEPGQRVLDLCAAPGGKSTQLAAKLRGEGVLVVNDNARERTKALRKNIERAGVRNAIVLNEEPAALAPVFADYFDRILVDAPCSGEGMFRKDEAAASQWEKHSVIRCAGLQRTILRDAAAMLAPGGRLVYSTCTFAPEENEAQIAALLAERPDLSILPIPLAHGWRAGRPDWASMARAAAGGEAVDAELPRAEQATAGTARLWPHRVRGEGHYVAVLVRAADASGLTLHTEPSSRTDAPDPAIRAAVAPREERRADRARSRRGDGKARGAAEADPIASWQTFARQALRGAEHWPGRLISQHGHVYLQPAGVPSLDGLRVVRPGWYLGEAGARRFDPSQPLAMGLRREDARAVLKLQADEEATARYLRGETLWLGPERLALDRDGGDGRAQRQVLVCIDGFPAGWGKWTDGMLKNGLASGWRWS
ncbi:RsmB/NOP family class I SAM-dependent RNA methyltransferase [Paenibacillus sp. IB182496]|uniref:RsmB/NOP family class I SAM-dependent RNA methyltransferase n=1 Tax=Paenibacillus sabuli TaxID=2772509 RepID=A0A927BTL7_9BACL|nr:RsmF rRNA methyltransferase first C-terminal domain-containing protein [Paenibacillus sabuli]MBD2846067.1 RsmB/NOP family class I SAM-dependent RNA methyltransferase [Paenibacillus sabuli]